MSLTICWTHYRWDGLIRTEEGGSFFPARSVSWDSLSVWSFSWLMGAKQGRLICSCLRSLVKGLIFAPNLQWTIYLKQSNCKENLIQEKFREMLNAKRKNMCKVFAPLSSYQWQCSFSLFISSLIVLERKAKAAKGQEILISAPHLCHWLHSV